MYRHADYLRTLELFTLLQLFERGNCIFTMPNSRIETKRTEEQMKKETKINYSLRMLHIRLRGRLQDLSFFDHLPPYVYIFYGIKVYLKSIF